MSLPFENRKLGCVTVRYCPTDEGHWRVDGTHCPVCGARIHVRQYIYEGTRPAEKDD